MKKGILTVFLMVMAVVFGVGLRYYMQTGSLLPQEQNDSHQAVVQETKVPEEISQETDDVLQESPDNGLGIMLSATDVTSDGMTLVCTQSGGSPTGELSTGPWYELEILKDGQWIAAPIYAEVCWEDIAWVIPQEDTTQWEINWTWIYGTLPAGEYRISKEIMDFRQTGDFDTCKSYACFTIE